MYGTATLGDEEDTAQIVEHYYPQVPVHGKHFGVQIQT
jgi:hypothetical protein